MTSLQKRENAAPRGSLITNATSHSAESLTPLDACSLRRQSGSGLEQSVLGALVIAPK